MNGNRISYAEIVFKKQREINFSAKQLNSLVEIICTHVHADARIWTYRYLQF